MIISCHRRCRPAHRRAGLCAKRNLIIEIMEQEKDAKRMTLSEDMLITVRGEQVR